MSPKVPAICMDHPPLADYMINYCTCLSPNTSELLQIRHAQEGMILVHMGSGTHTNLKAPLYNGVRDGTRLVFIR